ncbi:hypothetical protein P3X46_021138 [Hevea brasiliensis]|uniref:Uncharacterized protein n=1 Tax=Hevea brasiliensis TaxID=3981 RepID=A0ABQ9LFR4_HEVBR|nr:hypothetical protein P3X46_021138 [Hevea brasiliensis]
MNQIKAHPKGNVPFSWEKKPGVSRVAIQRYPSEEDFVKLPPPPCPIGSPRVSAHDIQIPLPPCTFQPPSRSSSSRSFRKQDDPFLAAYKECTKSTNKKAKLSKNLAAGSGLRKGIFNLFCKNCCSVRDDNLVRVSQIPYELKGRDVRKTGTICNEAEYLTGSTVF